MARSNEEIDAAGERLIAVLRSYGSAAVAFSGGVDSTVVAKAAQLALGDRAVAVTGVSDSLAQGELDAARDLARRIGVRHEVLETREFEKSAYTANDGTRCYHCKSTLYNQAAELRQRLHFDVLCSGANLDDLGDYRPGLTAAAERQVRHPLQEAGFTKEMTRELARHWGLPNWDKPATPCLSSRLAIGVQVTPERTRRVDDAERFLRSLGFSSVRVRLHEGEHARIEVDADEVGRLVDAQTRKDVVAKLKQLGFQFVSLDLEGFRSGGLNVLVPVELLRRPGGGA